MSKKYPYPRWCDDAVNDLANGELVWIKDKCFGLCAKCSSVVCLNKWLLGSAHFCA